METNWIKPKAFMYIKSYNFVTSDENKSPLYQVFIWNKLSISSQH